MKQDDKPKRLHSKVPVPGLNINQLTIQFILISASDMALLYENDAFSILVPQLENGTPVLWERFSFSKKSVSKLKY